MNASPHPGELRPAVAVRGEDEHGFTLTLEAKEGYAQAVDFQLNGVGSLVVDEPAPLGAGTGPSPALVLGAALGACLGASLLFCLRKARIEVSGLHTTVHGTVVRNERGRMRVGAIVVRLEPVIPEEQRDRMARCVAVFEDFCVVTASVRPSIDVRTEVIPRWPGAAALSVPESAR